MQRKEVERIVNRAYPKIVQDLGIGKRGVPPVEVHKDIYARLSGDPEAMGEDSKTSEAEYDWDNNKIFIYYPNMKNEEDVLRSLLHEHTHTLQDRSKEKKYREMGYENNPHEIESRKAEKNWKKYKNIKPIKESRKTMKHLPTYKEFVKDSGERFNIRIPTREEALKLRQGDQVIDKTQQEKGVGMIISIDDERGTAILYFYDDLVDSTFNQNIPFHVKTKNLFAVAAQEN